MWVLGEGTGRTGYSLCKCQVLMATLSALLPAAASPLQVCCRRHLLGRSPGDAGCAGAGDRAGQGGTAGPWGSTGEAGGVGHGVLCSFLLVPTAKA